jgi:hypothetical protein
LKPRKRRKSKSKTLDNISLVFPLVNNSIMNGALTYFVRTDEIKLKIAQNRFLLSQSNIERRKKNIIKRSL